MWVSRHWQNNIIEKICNVIDLDSSLFDDMFTYCEVIKHLDSLGKIVLVSTHKLLRENLKKIGVDYYVVCPSVELKDKWIYKLSQRYQEDDNDKNFRAWTSAVMHYDSHVSSLIEEDCKGCLVIENIDYQLGDIVKCLLC